jgi:hypothetical protein
MVSLAGCLELIWKSTYTESILYIELMFFEFEPRIQNFKTYTQVRKLNKCEMNTFGAGVADVLPWQRINSGLTVNWTNLECTHILACVYSIRCS